MIRVATREFRKKSSYICTYILNPLYPYLAVVTCHFYFQMQKDTVFSETGNSYEKRHCPRPIGS
jgi:hypothetical protein